MSTSHTVSKARTIANGQIHGRGKVEWLTPPSLIEAFGEFDLDPCSPINRPWPTAKAHYTAEDDGLTKPWSGRVWLNPPYDYHAERWMEKLAEHGNGIALIFARTDTKSFFDNVWERGDAALFLRGRLRFHLVDGSLPTHTNCGAPSVLVAYGTANVEALRRNAEMGALVDLHAGGPS